MHKPAKNSARKGSGEIVIPDKLYFRIGEVSRLCGLPSYVLRFWETEFPQLKPPKSSTGQRTYRRADVENVVRIKKLLYDEGFTIAGARAQLKAEGKRKQTPLPFIVRSEASMAELKQLRQGLRDILWILNNRQAARTT
ncbi:MAG TPA: MerR family transcriptional regulator [Terriglobales bacterium]|nr:MerR family transcriptional regulator [Terriglobales bacterium]